MHDMGGAGAPYRYASELGSGEDADFGVPADEPQVGVWETYEMQVVLHDVAGQGLVRCWKNGVLLGTFTNNNKTLLTATSMANSFLFGTSWSGLAPQTQSHGIDAISVPASRRLEFNRSMVDFFRNREGTGMFAFLTSCHPDLMSL